MVGMFITLQALSCPASTVPAPSVTWRSVSTWAWLRSSCRCWWSRWWTVPCAQSPPSCMTASSISLTASCDRGWECCWARRYRTRMFETGKGCTTFRIQPKNLSRPLSHPPCQLVCTARLSFDHGFYTLTEELSAVKFRFVFPSAQPHPALVAFPQFEASPRFFVMLCCISLDILLPSSSIQYPSASFETLGWGSTLLWLAAFVLFHVLCTYCLKFLYVPELFCVCITNEWTTYSVHTYI